MKKILVFFLFLFLYGDIDKKIVTTKQTLNQTKIAISSMNNQLDLIAKQINREEIYLSNIVTQIDKVNIQIKNLKNSLRDKNKNLRRLIYKKNILLRKKGRLEKKVIDFISRNFYLKKQKISDEKDLINEEIMEIITKQSNKEMDKILDIYDDIDKKIQEISITISNIKNAKKILQNRRIELANLKQQQKEKLTQLKNIKLKYKEQLDTIISNQNQLQNQLSKLNIIKTKELEKQRKLANENLKRKLREKQQQQKHKKIDKVKVKNYGNIYMQTKTIRYRGKKTIAPLSGKIVKKFGAYTDPVYNISLYNDSITIQAKPNSKVKAIFAGKVVFVGNTSDGKMIVIKHKNKVHSIYAKLSRISPFIKKGYRVKKGEVIAKINNELEFEVTYKTLPINPLQVIKF